MNSLSMLTPPPTPPPRRRPAAAIIVGQQAPPAPANPKLDFAKVIVTLLAGLKLLATVAVTLSASWWSLNTPASTFSRVHAVIFFSAFESPSLVACMLACESGVWRTRQRVALSAAAVASMSCVSLPVLDAVGVFEVLFGWPPLPLPGNGLQVVLLGVLYACFVKFNAVFMSRLRELDRLAVEGLPSVARRPPPPRTPTETLHDAKSWVAAFAMLKALASLGMLGYSLYSLFWLRASWSPIIALLETGHLLTLSACLRTCCIGRYRTRQRLGLAAAASFALVWMVLPSVDLLLLDDWGLLEPEPDLMIVHAVLCGICAGFNVVFVMRVWLLDRAAVALRPPRPSLHIPPPLPHV